MDTFVTPVFFTPEEVMGHLVLWLDRQRIELAKERTSISLVTHSVQSLQGVVAHASALRYQGSILYVSKKHSRLAWFFLYL